jgi:hypothetical protein
MCTKLYYNNLIHVYRPNRKKLSKNELMSFIYSAWLYTLFTGKLLVMGSAIINSVFICSIDTLCLLMFSLVMRYLISIYLLLLLLIIIIKENYNRVIAEYLYGLTVKSTILTETFNKMFHISCMCNEFIACNTFSFHSRRSNYNLLTASLALSLNKKIYNIK